MSRVVWYQCCEHCLTSSGKPDGQCLTGPDRHVVPCPYGACTTGKNYTGDES